MKSHDHAAVVATSYPPLSGNQPSLIENSQIASSASQKYGKAEVITKIGGSRPSTAPPRRQPDTSPISVPRTNAKIVVIPTRKSVQGSACSTWCETVSGKNVSEMPKCPRAMLPRYAKYAWRRLSCVLIPKAISRACIACGFTCPLYLDIIASAALPGMRRGIRKFSVTAAQRVTRKKPSLRTTNLTSRASCLGCSTGYALGFRLRSITPQSGFSYAAGLAKVFSFVAQPDRSLVLYWYQSTPSVTGIT